MQIKLYSPSFDFNKIENAAGLVLPEYIKCKTCALSAEIDFFDKSEIQSLNARTRSKDAVTDVLSYPSLESLKDTKVINDEVFFTDSDGEGGVFIGSIAICEEVAKIQAEEFDHSLDREINYLAVHGLLHLLGFDHETEEDKKIMRLAEEEIMEKAGIKR